MGIFKAFLTFFAGVTFAAVVEDAILFDGSPASHGHLVWNVVVVSPFDFVVLTKGFGANLGVDIEREDVPFGLFGHLADSEGIDTINSNTRDTVRLDDTITNRPDILAERSGILDGKHLHDKITHRVAVSLGVLLELVLDFFGWDRNGRNKSLVKAVFAESFSKILFKKFNRGKFAFAVAGAAVYVNGKKLHLIIFDEASGSHDGVVAA